MRFLLNILFIFLIFQADARNFYVSASGNDSNSGLSPSAPWKTIDKVNGFATSMANGDSILFKSGDVFYGTLHIKKSVKVDRYDVGISPELTGFYKLTGFIQIAPNIWETNLNTKGNLNLVTVNGIPQAIARFPNIDAPNGGYRFYKNAGIIGGNMYIVDTTASKFISVGDEVAARVSEFRINRGRVYRVAGDSIYMKMTYNLNSSVTPSWGTVKNGFGFFGMGNKNFLDKQGEWVNDTVNHKFQIYSTVNPNTLDIRAALKDTGINCSGISNVSIKNIDFSGYNCYSIWNKNATNISLDNITTNGCGGNSILVLNVVPALINNVRVTNSLSYGIQAYNRKVSGTTITNCIVTNCGLIPGQGSFYDGREYTAISANSNDLVMSGNTITNFGYVGYEWQGNNVLVENNSGANGGFVLMDHGVYYSYVAENDSTTFFNRVLRNNFAFNAGGNNGGTRIAYLDGVGYYFDGRTMNVTASNNWAFDCYLGAQLNNPWNIVLRGNYFIDSKTHGVSFTKSGRIPDTNYDTMLNNTLVKNYFIQRNAGRYNYHLFFTGAKLYTDLPTEIQRFGVIDSNYYDQTNALNFGMDIYSPTAAIPFHPYSLASWQTEFGFDLNSQYIRKPQSYSLGAIVGSNLITNPYFTNGTGWSKNGAGTVTYSGSAVFDFGVSPEPNRWTNINRNIGAVASSKYYVLRLKTTGANYRGALEVYLRQSASPNGDLTPHQYAAFGTSPQWHEFVFNPVTWPAAQLVLSLNNYSGNGTKIDSASLYERTVTMFNIKDSIIISYNISPISKTVNLPSAYQQVGGSVYSSVNLSPYTGFLGTFYGMKSLSNSITASNPVCNGYLGTATVVDSGGTSPFQHLWSYNNSTGITITAPAGTYSVITTDANNNKDTAFVTLTQPSALGASNVVDTYNGAFSPVTVTATGGVLPYVWKDNFGTTKITNPAVFNSPIGLNTYTVTDDNGCSAQTFATVVGPIPDTTKPTVPTSLVATNITYSSATLSWNASTDNVKVVGYNLYRNDLLVAALGNVLTFNDGSLLENTSYSYKVAAIDSSGNISDFSTSVTFTTPLSPDVVAPSAPLIYTATNVSQTQLTISWNAAIDNRGVTAYKVYRNGSLIATLGNVLSYTNTGLTANTAYQYQAQALDAAGNASVLSPAYSVTTIANPDVTAPSKPAGLVAINVTQTQATINWNASTDNVGVTGYFLYRDNALLATLGNVTTFTNTGLSSSTSYTYAVEAFDAAGNISTISSNLVVTTLATPDVTAPATPTAPVLVSSTENALTISWAATTDNIGVAGYKMYRNGILVATLGNVLSYTYSGLSVNTGYSLAIQAYDASGNNSSISTAIVVTTPDLTAPSAPSNLRATNITKTTATINWTPSSDNVAVTGYLIFRNGIQIASVGGSNSSFNITRLVTGKKYVFTIVAIDGAGNKSVSSVALTFNTLGQKTQVKVTVAL